MLQVQPYSKKPNATKRTVKLSFGPWAILTGVFGLEVECRSTPLNATKLHGERDTSVRATDEPPEPSQGRELQVCSNGCRSDIQAIKQVASISAGNGNIIGALIADALAKVGKEGVIFGRRKRNCY
ncbi:hypothetical protein THAOC_06096 [Thalassiosira oceanica]|uniref:Uncharacterized protein n=1 Tax=Thalassiosira oceanica TaxID=159749 RepID=K0T168_THAOC|nr:hypothetical protein THAOC_06096 [Thalassiosira oceanica]|eukprot:EJK72378.1 hypothetical protein THAOC_06096 [Thalassiosira oceanica]